MVSSKYRRIYDVICLIPEGRVATYGQIATLAGLRGQPRLVGYALHSCPPEEDVPWQRVINAKGEVSSRSSSEGSESLQRVMLEAEGVAFNSRGRIDLDRFRWEPNADDI